MNEFSDKFCYNTYFARIHNINKMCYFLSLLLNEYLGVVKDFSFFLMLLPCCVGHKGGTVAVSQVKHKWGTRQNETGYWWEKVLPVFQ